MKNPFEFDHPVDVAWCPGCGNFGILTTIREALVEAGVSRENFVHVSGIGQAAKTPQYMNAHFFNGLHGRSLPVATAIKASNPSLTVVAESGDGCMYGEGGNHFIHAIRRNPDITVLVHNNMVYGLTKGQASPTSRRGFVTPVQLTGVTNEPFNPVAVAIALNASFVARAFCGDMEQTREIICQGLAHRGLAIIDIFQPCVSFNKVNTWKWYKEHTYYCDDNYDPTDRIAAFGKAVEEDRFPLGVLYKNTGAAVFGENSAAYRTSSTPLFQRGPQHDELAELMDEKLYR
jgi:2-oxoglutarate/2-oxoacid ferredoxin oxidoreductase subunit beta